MGLFPRVPFRPRSRIVSLFAEENELQYAVPGGLIGVGTKIDPMLTRADRLVGQVPWGSLLLVAFEPPWVLIDSNLFALFPDLFPISVFDSCLC